MAEGGLLVPAVAGQGLNDVGRGDGACSLADLRLKLAKFSTGWSITSNWAD
jgi:hypothetical protein